MFKLARRCFRLGAIFAVSGVCLLIPCVSMAGSRLIGQIGGTNVSGITFDDVVPGAPVVQLAGGSMLRLDPNTAATIQTYSLPTVIATRSLDYIGGGLYYQTEDQPTALFVANPSAGTTTRVGSNLNHSTFNFIDMAIDPTTGNLWAVSDSFGGFGGNGYLYQINRTTGVATLRASLSGIGQLVSMTIDPLGRFYVSNISGDTAVPDQIFQVNPTTFQTTPVTTSGYNAADYLADFGYDPTSQQWFGVVEQRSANPRDWLLVQLTGMPAVPEPASVGLACSGTFVLLSRRMRRMRPLV